MKVSQEELNQIAKKFIDLKRKVKKSKSKKLHREFREYQNFCIKQFEFLVHSRTYRYKKFTNYIDLEQDGFEALLLALKTYDPTRGNFSWWANKYISTRISRAANTHCAIRVPLKKAREQKPHKVDELPTMIDQDSLASEKAEAKELTAHLKLALDQLPEKHRSVIRHLYGLNDGKAISIENLTKRLSISRPQCLKIVEEAKNQLKSILGATQI